MLFFGDRDHAHLRRGQPQRERARVVLDQDAEEAFQRAEERAVDHVRLMQRAVRADVRDAEAFRQVEVELDRGGLPFAADRVLDLQVDLRAVERAAALVHFVFQAASFDCLDE